MDTWITYVLTFFIPLFIGGIVIAVSILRHWRWMAKNAPGYKPAFKPWDKGKRV